MDEDRPTDDSEVAPLEHQRARLEELIHEKSALAFRLAQAVRDRHSSRDAASHARVELLISEIQAHIGAANREFEAILTGLGLSHGDLDALEQLQNSGRASQDASEHLRLLRAEVAAAPTTRLFEDVLPGAVAAVQRQLDPNWLASQRALPHALGRAYTDYPFCLTGGRRISFAAEEPRAHRLARMVFLSEHHLQRADDLDIYDGRLLIPELAGIGAGISALSEMGPHALAKWRSLPELVDDDVESAVFELLVGFACVRNGLKPEMLDPGKKGAGEKTPDFRLHRWPIPLVAECKRRRGLTGFERNEAAWMRRVFERLRYRYKRNVRVELRLRKRATEVPWEQLAEAAERATHAGELDEGWGHVTVTHLRPTTSFERTRLYSPSFLSTVFGWDSVLSDVHDGIICQVDAPGRVAIDAARNPLALCWGYDDVHTPTAKFRKLTELIAGAIDQVPIGEMGIVFVAYEEGARSALADRRTKDISDDVSKWVIESGIRVIPEMRITRIYPGLLDHGRPDFVENTIRWCADGFEPGALGIPDGNFFTV